MSFVIYPLICAAAAGIILVAARLLRVRYSLRSLILFVLLAGSCEALYIDWGPWYLASEPRCTPGYIAFSDDGRYFATVEGAQIRFWSATTGREVPRADVASAAGGKADAALLAEGWSKPDTHQKFPDACRVVLRAAAQHSGCGWCDRVVGCSNNGQQMAVESCDPMCMIFHRRRPEWWWGIFYMLEFWFSAGFAAALVWSLLADRRTFARMDAAAAGAREKRSRPAAPLSDTL